MRTHSGSSLSRNATLAVAQTIVGGCVLFFLYRYLIATIGANQVGVWALVAASTSAARISEFGLSGSAIKFTAKYIAIDDSSTAASVVRTTTITIGSILAIALTLLLPILEIVLVKFIPPSNIELLELLLPYALLSVWTGAIAGIYSSALDGCQRADLKSLISMGANVPFIAALLWLVPAHGIVGIAFAQIIQSSFILIFTLWVIRRKVPELPLALGKWKTKLFREMLGYGANLQVAGFAAMLFEPMAKAMMSKFGGLEATAYFDMATRMVMQVRALLVNAMQVVVPTVASLHESGNVGIQRTYARVTAVVFFLALPLYLFMAVSAHLVGKLWIGHPEPQFVIFSAIVCLGSFANTLSGPAYFFNQGTGALWWNTSSHVTIGLSNLMIGVACGITFGAIGVAVGYTIALLAGSLLTILGYHYTNRLPFAALFPKGALNLTLACFLAFITALVVDHLYLPKGAGSSWLAIPILVYAMVVFPAIWKCPVRKDLMDSLSVKRQGHELRKSAMPIEE